MNILIDLITKHFFIKEYNFSENTFIQLQYDPIILLIKRSKIKLVQCDLGENILEKIIRLF